MRRGSQLWSGAIGLAFFAFSLGIFLPFSLALAGNHANGNPALMEICGIGGVKLIAPISSGEAAETTVSHGHEFCIYCGLSNAPLVEASVAQSLASYQARQLVLFDVQRLSYLNSLKAGDEIRGPPRFDVML